MNLPSCFEWLLLALKRSIEQLDSYHLSCLTRTDWLNAGILEVPLHMLTTLLMTELVEWQLENEPEAVRQSEWVTFLGDCEHHSAIAT